MSADHFSHSRPPFVPHATFYVGIDGGGSGTRAQLCAQDGRTLARGQAGPSGLGQGIGQAWGHVTEAIARAFAEAGLAQPRPQELALGLGLAGASVASRRDAFLREAPDYAALVLDTDGTTTLLGAHGGRPGAVVAAGTGSVGEALRRDGQRISVGGWGFPIGDEGSGAWLGFQAVRHAHRVLDGRLQAGALARSVFAVTGDRVDAVLAWMEGAGQHAYAQLAPRVFEAEWADPVAAMLITEAIKAIEDIARALDAAGELPLALLGSIGRRLMPRLAPDFTARCVEPMGDSTDGALHLLSASADAGRQTAPKTGTP
ncbi:BadF/BadG/BcrA/BcrD ATPase family protein [Niveibacterium umoris]|uniref:Glucosamine kinase n=1 Tax=Niveibacterium umoris TaxID=1193620 RepID=A0A840BGI8_9RHOO|nr:BadF/BadG/BcrA/BcrD ATPase family protein [Niveibacterium umoris]MBB4010788.1 glucosamine kinase [Niveibacterium umoris]